MKLNLKFGLRLLQLLSVFLRLLLRYFRNDSFSSKILQVMNPQLMVLIEWLLCRNIHFTVTSAFRTKEQNEACGGSENSQHLTGDAVDLKPLDISVDCLVDQIINAGFNFDQIIKYRTFVHVSFARARKPRQMQLNFTDRK